MVAEKVTFGQESFSLPGIGSLSLLQQLKQNIFLGCLGYDSLDSSHQYLFWKNGIDIPQKNIILQNNED